MNFEDFVCEKLKNAGDVKAKKMFGTYNICLDKTNLGVLCVNKWYLKKTLAGDVFIKANNMNLETGIKDNDEVLRALYTLEGRSLVSPEPPGSFTSNVWKITEIGIKAFTLSTT